MKNVPSYSKQCHFIVTFPTQHTQQNFSPSFFISFQDCIFIAWMEHSVKSVSKSIDLTHIFLLLIEGGTRDVHPPPPSPPPPPPFSQNSFILMQFSRKSLPYIRLVTLSLGLPPPFPRLKNPGSATSI